MAINLEELNLELQSAVKTCYTRLEGSEGPLDERSIIEWLAWHGPKIPDGADLDAIIDGFIVGVKAEGEK